MPDTQSIPSLSIRLLGDRDVQVNGRSLSSRLSRKEYGLLATLALRSVQETARDVLAVSFWPDSEESQARFYLRKSLSNLRRALGSEAVRLLSPTPRTVRLDMSGAFCDVLVFHSTLAQAAVSAEPSELLKQAIALYRGPFFPECVEEWAISERTRSEQAYLSALERVAQQARASGNPVEAVRWLRQLVAADPYRESAVCLLLQALADSGDRAALLHVYQDLRLRLRSDLNAEPADETAELFQRLSQHVARPSHGPAKTPPSAAASLRHLPVPLTGLIGREQEVEEVAGWLRSCRLVTLLGPGGVGKTRLSIAVAERVLSAFVDGVWFVDLSPLTDQTLVPEVTAKALDLIEERGLSAMERLTHSLTARSRLIVLDNCEHVIDACVSLANHLLTNCAELRIVATSRQVLGLTGEQVYPVPSLSLPPEGNIGPDRCADLEEKDPRAPLEYEAVRLFVERARQNSPSFVLNRSNMSGAVEICRRLDGIPLAIEMAAARLRSFSVGEINDRLSDRFRLLKSGSKSALPRQQTLRAALDWSYDLLTPVERDLHDRLAVFAGGFTLEAAAALSGLPDVDASLETLSSLVDKSLVVYDAGENPRYRMLETVREYGKERLEERGELAEFRRLHRDYFTNLVVEAMQHRKTREELLWFQRVERDYPNVWAALDFCEEDPESVGVGLEIAYALFGFWLSRGALIEGRDRCQRLLSLPQSRLHAIARADALRTQAALLYYMGESTQAKPLAEAALAVYRERSYPIGIAYALSDLANYYARCGDYSIARTYLDESVTICRQIDNPRLLAKVLHGFAGWSMDVGDLDAARDWLGEALEYYKELGSQAEIAISYQMLSQIEHSMGDYDLAQEYGEEALRIAQEENNRLYISECLGTLSKISLGQGQEQLCLSYCRANLELQKVLMIKNVVTEALQCLSTLAIRQEKWETAACLGAFAETDDGARIEQMFAIRKNLGEPAFQAACNKGARMTTTEAIEFALSTL